MAESSPWLSLNTFLFMSKFILTTDINYHHTANSNERKIIAKIVISIKNIEYPDTSQVTVKAKQ